MFRFDACTIIVVLAMFLTMLASGPARGQMNWVPDPGNPIRNPFSDGNVVPSVLYDEDRDVWLAWYGANGLYDIAYAESDDGVHWPPGPPEVVLSGESGAAWERVAKWAPSVIYDPAHPSVVEDEEGERYAYQMWYNGYSCGDSCGWPTAIGYVVSHDGKNWVRPPEVGQEPVLTKGGPGDWDSSWIHLPSVVYDPVEDVYRMWYSGSTGTAPNNIGLATSKNGVDWEKHPGPLQLRRPGERNTINCGVLYNGTHYEMWFSFGGGAARWDIHYARSLDGITWTRPPISQVVIPSGGAWDDGGTCNPHVFFDGVSYRAWYTGDCNSGGSWLTGTATFEAELPRPRFEVGPQGGLVSGQRIEFDASGSNSPVVSDPEEFSYSWDFGDGATGGEMTEVHVYDNPGDYRVRLTFHDGQQSASIERIVRVDLRSEPEPQFRRGDDNGDGKVDVSDPINSLSVQFLGEGFAGCIDAMDFNDDGRFDVSDPISSLSHQFLGTDPPPAPGKDECGPDSTPDDKDPDDPAGGPNDELGCDVYPAPAAPVSPDRQCD